MRGLAATLLLSLALANIAAAAPGVLTIFAAGDAKPEIQVDSEADIENGVPIDDQTVFRFSSLTKQFTSVAILALIEDRKLSLDETLANALPDCPNAWRPITIEQLLSHTSGLTGDMAPIFAHARDDFAPHDLLAPYMSLPLEAEPGTRWRYSNLNYWILGQVIERASGEPYASFVAERVLSRLGSSSVRLGSSLDIIPHRARGYSKSDGGLWRNAPYFSATLGYAAGGFIGAPADLARWYAALGSGRIISQASIARAAREVRLHDGTATGYGLGWYVERKCGLVFMHHGGSAPGFRTYLYWQPDRRLLAGIFTNHDDQAEPKRAAWELMREHLACGDS